MNKYRNLKVKSASGEIFDSKLEYKHFLELNLLEKAGKISHLKKQVLIPLGLKGAVKYRADFVYFDFNLNSWIIFDSKGVETKEFKVKLKWLLESYDNFIFILAKRNNREMLRPENLAERDFGAFVFDFIKKKGKK